MNNDNENKFVSKFLKVFILTFTMLILMVGIGTAIYIQTVKGNTYTGQIEGNAIDENANGVTDDGLVDVGTVNEQKITTFSVFGVDEDGFRTDVIMLVFFNVETMKIDVVSVPRDTKVKIPEEVYSEILERRSDVDQIVKINEISAYANPTTRYETTVTVLEDTFGIDIDYYIKMDLNGFRSIVDIVGPIMVDVPFDMKYEDPYQDLYINLSAGLQPINGAQAESLIRYRSGYANGDLGRIETQKKFMTGFLDEALKLENKINIVNIAAATMVYIDTDFMNSVDYLHYIDDIYAENVSFSTIPGNAVYMDHRSYFVYDYDETKVLFNNIINGETTDVEEIAEEEVITPKVFVDARELTISVQNGTNISGLAGGAKELLISEGYNAIEAVNYNGEDEINKTKLMVPTEEVGEALSAYYEDPDVEVISDMIDEELQVIIILGPEEGDN